MALCRCQICGVKKSRSKKNYVTTVDPIGYPNAAVICGIAKCTNPAKVWLDDNDLIDYQNGLRLFGKTVTSMVKIGVV